MNEPSILRTVAGDDLTFAVEFSGAAVDFADGHRAELILHYPDGTDEPIVPVCQEGNVATFALTGAKTRELLKKNPTGRFRYCIRLYWADGCQYTPVHREPLIIEGC